MFFVPVSITAGICPAEANIDTTVPQQNSPFTVFTIQQASLTASFITRVSLPATAFFPEVSQGRICPAEDDTAVFVIPSSFAAENKHHGTRIKLRRTEPLRPTKTTPTLQHCNLWSVHYQATTHNGSYKLRPPLTQSALTNWNNQFIHLWRVQQNKNREVSGIANRRQSVMSVSKLHRKLHSREHSRTTHTKSTLLRL